MPDFPIATPPREVTDPVGFKESGTTTGFKEYPRHVYPPDWPRSVVKVVHDDKSKAAALKDGFSLTPPKTALVP